jgi:hypothetical protein
MSLNRRVLVRRGSAVAAVAIAAALWSGCSGKTVTEFVAGVSSQVQVPRDLAAISITVSAEGNIAYNKYFPVYNGNVLLPKTLGVVNSSTPEGTPISITIVGFDNSPSGQAAFANAQNFQGSIPTVGTTETGSLAPGGRVLRSFRQQYTPGQILYVPMPLHYSCYDVDCGPNSPNDISQCNPASDPNGTDQYDPCTCKAGVCVDALNDPTVNPLPVYNDGMAYGTTNTCFRPFSDKDASGNTLPGCMDYGIPPQTIQAGTCVYALPDTASVPADAGAYNPNVPKVVIQAADSGGGLNVRVVFDNLVSEVLDYEGVCPAQITPATPGPVEGYCTMPNAPQQFMLAPGLCTMVPGGATPANKLHTITLIEASAECPSKTQFQPICADADGPPWQPTLIDGGSSANGTCNVAVPLVPAPSALYLLWDNSTGMDQFFGKKALSQVIGLSLSDPVFQQTQVAFSYTPALPTDCTAAPDTTNSFLSPLIPFEPSAHAQADIAKELLLEGEDGGIPHEPGADPWYLEAALDGAYQKLQLQTTGAQKYNRTAAMLFIDRDFKTNPPDCGNSHKNAIQEAQAALSAGIETYVVYLANADYEDAGGAAPPPAESDAQSLAMGLNPNLSYFFNASAGSSAPVVAAEALSTVVADMGSCVYEVPSGIDSAATLQFPDPVTRTILTVTNADSCANDSSTTPLWVFDNQHIRVCQNTCQRLVTAIQADEAATAQSNAANNTLNAAAGVTVYATESCGAPDAATIVESGTAPNNYDAGISPPSDDAGSVAPDDSGTAISDGAAD